MLKQRQPNPNQRGFAFVAYIFLVVVIFSILIVTGSFSLAGSTATAKPTPTPTLAPGETPGPDTPTPTPDDSIPTAAPTSAPASLSHRFLGCGDRGLPAADITAYNSTPGYMIVEKGNNAGGYDYYVGAEFIPPGRQYGVVLLSNQGFNTRKWRVRLFSGGAKKDGKWQGGEEKATDTGDPTGC